MYKLCFTVPKEHCENVKQALFDAGAGTQDNYKCCAWQTLGTGQFLPMEGSNPTYGKVGSIETIAEMKVEMICEDQYISNTISALKKAHPYESPAYDVWRLENI